MAMTCRPYLGAIFLASVLQTGPAHAQTDQVVIAQAWSRATPANAKTGAVYVTLTSTSGDRLTGVSSPAARQADVHEMRMAGTVMQMRELPDGLDLPAGQPVRMTPGGYHIMLTDLTAPLKQGQTVRVRLSFAKSLPVEIDAPIAALGAAGPPGVQAPVMKMP